MNRMVDGVDDAELIPPNDDRELAALLAVLTPIFNFPPGQGERYAAIVGAENFRILNIAGTLAGGLALLPMGQFFGGRSVPMTGIAVVGVAPQFRGSGAATAMMRATIRQLHEQGVAISTLYPATLPLYRRAGYELAGARLEFSIATKSIGVRDRSCIVRQIGEEDHESIEKFYHSWAAHQPGALDRSPFIWSRVRNRLGEPLVGYLVHGAESSQPQGYVYFFRKESTAAPYSLILSDLVATTPGAALRLLTFLADHGTMTDTVTWQGALNDPIVCLMPERGAVVKTSEHWMVRIVDVKRALEARGYSPAIRSEVHFEIDDDLIEDNCGRFTLRVDGASGRVESGGRGDLRLDIRALASLFTGFASPRGLSGQGRLILADSNRERVLDEAAAVFAGPMPVLRDRF